MPTSLKHYPHTTSTKRMLLYVINQNSNAKFSGKELALTVQSRKLIFVYRSLAFCLTEYKNKTKKAQGTNRSCREKRSA